MVKYSRFPPLVGTLDHRRRYLKSVYVPHTSAKKAGRLVHALRDRVGG